MRTTSSAAKKVALQLVIALFFSHVVRAEEIRVLTSGAFTSAYLALAPEFERATRHKLVTVTTSMGFGTDSIPSRLQRGEPADVVILPAAMIDDLIAKGLVSAGGRVDLARSAIGMAVRASARKPDISSVDALKRTLLEAKSIAYSASVSGTYLSTELFQHLGIADQVKGKTQRIERERVGAVVARGEAEIGFQQISELLPIAGIHYVGPLPADVQRVTLLSAAVTASSKNPEAARAFITFLASSAAATTIAKSGLELIEDVEIATALAFTEGPTVDRDGAVYFTDLVSMRIMKLSPGGVLSTYRDNSNAANGLLIDPQGRLIACEGADSRRTGVLQRGKPQVTRTDLKTGTIEILADHYQGAPLMGPNDVTMDGQGRLYFTDLTGAAVYRIDAPGRIVRILAAPEIQRPNGIQISPDDKTLYLIEANGAQDGARMIRAYDLLPDGTVRNMRVHYNFYPGRSADGMSIDSQGNLYAAAGLHRTRGTSETLDTKCGVHVISPQGKLVKFITIPEDTITNTAFGGPDMKTLYVTAGKTLFKVRTDIPGLPR
jgi:sugar lactone lactonase YvrE/ABC-type molybdate transport system substrate-binding protein